MTTLLALTTLLVGVDLQAQAPRPRVREAAVAIVVQRNRATVQARYGFIGNPGALSFELLQQRCAVVGPISIRSRGEPVPLSLETTGPWLRLHDTSAVDPARDSLGYTISYDVALQAGAVSIPVLLPLAVLRGDRRGAPIAQVTVTLPEGGRVTLPRMAQSARGRWTATLAALPSAVRIRGATPNALCGDAAPAPSGRFKLIFWALVTTLALWVPAYLWWANRRSA